MKTMLRNINILLILVMAFPIIAISCSDDDSSAANLSFSRSIYILPSSGSLEVELRASVPPETDLIVPVNIEGTAELNEDYEISAKEFTIKAGETSGKLILIPKNNLTSGREIRLSINPVNGYVLGDKKIAIIPIETKERIMYSFTSSYSRVLSTVEIWVEVQGEISGKSFKALSDITFPLEIGSSSSAIIGTDFTAPTSITIPKNGRQAHFTVAIQEDAEDYAGKTGDTYQLFYNAEDKGFIMRATPYKANSKYYDAFYGSTSLDLSAYRDQWNVTVPTDIEMIRPMARYNLIATDVDKFLQKVDKKEITGKKFTITVKYNYYLPTAFDALTGKLKRSLQYMEYNKTVELATLRGLENKDEFTIGFDYLLINNESAASVPVTIEITNESKKVVARYQNLKIPYERNKETNIRGHFMTASPGIDFDPDFEDEDIIIDVTPITPTEQ